MASGPSDRRPIVLSGPSGVGKETLYQMLQTRYPNTFTRTVSHTTRQPREGEREGVNYFYVSHAYFTDLVARDGFVEHAFFGGNHYGTSKETILKAMGEGLVVIIEVEMEGVKQIKSNSSIDTRTLFIGPPSFEALEARLRSRGSETEADIQKRLAQAKAELDYADSGAHDKVIVNDDLDKAFNELHRFIFGMASQDRGD